MNSTLKKLGLVMVLLSGCSTRNLEYNIPDSFFKYNNKVDFNLSQISIEYDALEKKYDLIKLDSIQRVKISDKIFGSTKPYGAFFYSKQHTSNSIVIYAYADDYAAFILCELSTTGDILSYLEMAFEQCDVRETINDKEIIECYIRSSKIINGSTILVYDLKTIDFGYGILSEPIITDSITYKYRFDQGFFRREHLDSVRLIKKKQ